MEKEKIGIFRGFFDASSEPAIIFSKKQKSIIACNKACNEVLSVETIEGHLFKSWMFSEGKKNKPGEIEAFDGYFSTINFNNEKWSCCILRPTYSKTDYESFIGQMMPLGHIADRSIVVFTREGLIKYVNEFFIEKTGFLREEILESNIKRQNVILSDSNFRIWRKLQKGEVWEGELTRLAKSGRKLVELARVIPFANKDGKFERFMKVSEDITIMRLVEGLVSTGNEKEDARNRQFEFFYICAAGGIIIDRCHRLIRRNKIISEIPENIESFILENLKSVLKKNKNTSLYYRIPNSHNERLYEIRYFPLTKKECFVAFGDISEYRKKEDEIVEARLRHQALFDKSQDAIIITKNWKTIDVNQASMKMFGETDINQFSLKYGYDYSPEFQPDGSNSREKAFMYVKEAQQEPQKFYWQHRRNNGTLFDAEVSLVYYRNGDDEFLQSTIRDITFDIKNKLQLEESERKLRQSLDFTNSLINTIPNPVFYKNAEGIYIGCSKAFEEYLGIPREKIIGHTVYDVSPPDLAEIFDKADKDLINTGNKQVYESKMAGLDGEERNVIFNKSVYYDSDGKKSGIVGVIYDITDFRKAESAARESQEKYFRLFSESNDAILIYQNRRLVDCNKKALKLFKAEKDELLNSEQLWPKYQPNGKISHGGYSEIIRQVAKGSFLVFEWSYNNFQGDTFDAEVSASSYVHENNTYIQFYIRDITETRRIREELKEAERSMRTLLNNLPGMAYRTRVDENWTIEFVSYGCEELTGYSVGEILSGKVISDDIIHPDDFQEVKSMMRKCIRSKTHFQFIYRIITKQGVTKWVWEKGESIFDKFGNPVAVEGFTTDMTELKQKEQELILNEQKYYSLFSKANDAIMILQNEIMIDCNETALLMFACRKADLISKPLFAFSPAFQADGSLSAERGAEIIKAGDKGKQQVHNWRFLRKDGISFDAEVGHNAFMVNDERYTQVIIRDITERIISENKVKESRRNYKNLVESFPDGIAISVKNNIVYINQTGLNLLGVKDTIHLSERTIFNNFSPENRKKLQKKLEEAQKGMIQDFTEVLYRRPADDQQINIEIKFLKYIYNNQNATQIIIRDISTRKELELQKIRSKAMQEANEKLQREIQERVKTEKKLKNSLQEKEVLIKEVHHRVKNNLQIISSILNLQSSFITNEEVVNMIHESQDRIKSMALVHENLYKNKDLSQIDFDEYIINLSNNLYRSYGIDFNNIKLHLKLDKVFLPLDIGIPCGLILNELIANSIKYAFQHTNKGNIFVILKTSKKGEVKLIVADDGIGMSKEIDFKNTKSLGLQLVTTLVEQIDGKIILNTEKGTEFTILFKYQTHE
ncbi:MAG: PAS domain S-box protein [Bacteroidetes bacterium]|nr:PAS domain S-box protein [Bacteroidota bacterium]